MTNIEEYLLDYYKSTNKKMYRKIYYLKHRDKILKKSNDRYDDRLKKGDVKYNKGTYIIKFN